MSLFSFESVKRRIFAASRVSASPEELAIAEKIVDREFYNYRYHDVVEAGIDPVEHFLTFGWKEERDPNPYTLLRFVIRSTPSINGSFLQLARHLNGSIYHNPLLRKPASLTEIRAALHEGDEALSELFVFDVASYSEIQHDVLAAWPDHPVSHLFTDGLFQSRLRNGRFLHPMLVPFESYINDYEMLIAQDAPLKASSFFGLDLSQPEAEIEVDISDIKLCIGVVLYKNSAAEIERLVRSVQSNAAKASYSVVLRIWDNSPEHLDLGEVEALCPGVTVHIERHPENVGFALGHNGLLSIAINEGATHYLGLNPDGYLLPSSVEQVLRFAAVKDHPILIEMDCEPLPHPKWYHPITGETDWVSGAAFLMDAETYARTGGFDPAFPMYCEDTDLSFRARMSGVKLYVSPRGRYYHDTTDRLHTTEPWRTERMMVGTWYLCHKWGHTQRAERVKAEMLLQGFDTEALPMAPTRIAEIPEEIHDLLQKERFARSRFWGG